MHLWLLATVPALRLPPAVGIATGNDMQGCGGATPFAPFAGGGSGSDQSKWAPGGQWSRRQPQTSTRSSRQQAAVHTPMGHESAPPPPEQVEGTTGTGTGLAPNAHMGAAVGSLADMRAAAPVGITPGADMQGCGGAAPFAPYAGGGSGSDQSKWAPGGQWTTRASSPPPYSR